MKVVVSAKSNDIKSEVDPRFGRCRYFIIAHIENKVITSIEIIENTAKELEHGAGTKAAEIVAETGAKVLITGRLGPNAIEALSHFGIQAYSATCDINSAIKDFIDEKLKRI
ncbi:dinitrogenase iron-molybdenum cofactor biosynthesis protein [Candidatus Woesearchaeota archaeon CG11_big_fil_rev_8_21_14_0_20_43_8]|nr:MAG: dinitrogenase iron-molybdenum cofactor biosynthesis protein [Candidatus Woesearchaeota archaeon CG11_big_fil_rev_8_21_14_0_20_43_8]PIO07566.1 MAG: dinitrogenase iron-molybdenum cofactor biosynthesis protein [Candidatus Woesearchaeota archaeon CG08_land_8_20_14_0_20_43_7]